MPQLWANLRTFTAREKHMKNETLKLALVIEEFDRNNESLPLELLKPIAETLRGLAQRTEQNFCPRCGKRTNDIHTCTPPQENT